jgi:hypothetical protein
MTEMMSMLSVDPSSGDFINPLVSCVPLCLDQAMRSLLLKVLPKLDNIDIAPRQAGNQSHGMHMPRIDAAGSWRSADVTSGPRKGKEKAAPSRSASKARS